MSLLEDYEQQFGALTAEATSKINTIPNQSGKQRHDTVADVERIFEEAKELIEQMDLEVRELPAAARAKASTRIRGYNDEVGRLQKEFRRAQVQMADVNQGRDELLGPDDPYHSEDQRTRLLENTEKMQRTSNRLEEGYKMVLETEEIGRGIMDNLHRDRETITRARDRLRGVDQDLGKSGRILNAMVRRIYQNRIILAVVGLLMVGVIGVGIYFATK